MQNIRAECETMFTDATFTGYIMDSTATNRGAMKKLQEDDPSIVVLPCISHALSLVVKHAYKFFAWVREVYDACLTISEKVNKSQKLGSELTAVQKRNDMPVRTIATHTPTRFGSRDLVRHSIVKNRTALFCLACSDEWKTQLKGNKGFQAVHDFMMKAEDSLFDRCELLGELMEPVMRAIHQFEADQPMLSFVGGVFKNLKAHFDAFETEHPELSMGTIPADKRSKDSAEKPILLSESLQRDVDFAWRPSMTAASVLDPLNWEKNIIGKYRVPIHPDARNEFSAVVANFSNGDELLAETEVVGLQCFSFPTHMNPVLEKLTARTTVGEGVHRRTVVAPHTHRIDFLANSDFASRFPLCVKVAEKLLGMPVTATASERNWSRWKQVFVDNRSRLGLGVAENLVYIQQNDPTMVKFRDSGDGEVDFVVE